MTFDQADGNCLLCGGQPVARRLPVCGSCLKADADASERLIADPHRRSQAPLAALPPRAESGVGCEGCGNRCRPNEGEKGFCGLRINRGGQMVQLAGGASGGLAFWYSDSIPTNCVSSWVCPATTGAGYPRYCTFPTGDRGRRSLAVFLGGCSFNCLFCQNRSHHRMAVDLSPLVSAAEAAGAVDEQTVCLCFFGGDPSPQMDFALQVAQVASDGPDDKTMRICWETNGSMSPEHLQQMTKTALHSGGCIKFDLKALDENLHRALTGTDNRQTLKNFQKLAASIEKRPRVPLVTASTLLVPGYVDADEVADIAGFIAKLNPSIPYSLLAFHPQHLFSDLPRTSRRQAEDCLQAAREAGLRRVRLGNTHLLG